MKFSLATALVVSLAAEATLASSWFSKAAYNKWHESELERWLSDHNVPYPTPADRKELENLVKTQWKAAVESPYMNWDAHRLQKHLKAKGKEIKKGTEKSKDQLVKQVQSTWEETGDKASDAYKDVTSWIFDSWTESQLKSFADKHGIPAPQPRTRDSLLKVVRENFQSIANKAGETTQYPGNWLYHAWSDSDLKAWFDEHGIPVPQTGTRDKLIAEVRRNSYLASKEARHDAAHASASAEAVKESLTNEILDAWSESQLKEFFDKNGIKVPQGSTRNELIAIARKNAAKLTGDNIPDAAASAYGAATSSAGNEFAKASKEAHARGNQIADNLYDQIKGYVDEVMIMVGLKTNYASSASKSAAKATASAASAYSKATDKAKAEL